LSIAFFVFAALCALATANEAASATVMMAVPFALLGLNLGAAILTQARFRSDTPLLVFHLALMAIALLFVFSRLTYFDGYAVLSRGQVFNGTYERSSYGPLHGPAPRPLPFVNVAFYEMDPDGPYPKVVNRVMWKEPSSGQWKTGDIQNDRPLHLSGYRIYPRRFDGLSPLFRWARRDGLVDEGMLPLPPSDRAADFPRGVAWTLPGGPEIWAMLRLTADASAAETRLNAGADTIRHVVVLRVGEARHELLPGASIELDQGRLTYVALDAWKGYRVVHDPAEPWLAGAIIVAILALVWFYALRIARPVRQQCFE
jgi:cytochrome c biogenesis protein